MLAEAEIKWFVFSYISFNTSHSVHSAFLCMAQLPDFFPSRSESQTFVFVSQNPNDNSKKASVYSQARRDTERKKRKRAISALKTAKPLPVKHFSAEEPTSSKSYDGFDLSPRGCNSEFWHLHDAAVEWPLSPTLDSSIPPLQGRPHLLHPAMRHSMVQATNNMQLESSMRPTLDLGSQHTEQNYLYCEQQCDDMLPATLVDNCTYHQSAYSSERLDGQSSLLEDVGTQVQENSDYSMPLLTLADATWDESMLYDPYMSNVRAEKLDTSTAEEGWSASVERGKYHGSFPP